MRLSAEADNLNIFPRKENYILACRNKQGEFDDDILLKKLWFQIRLYNMLCEIEQPEYEITGDGEIDLWYEYRVYNGFDIARIYYRKGDTSKGEKILLEHRVLICY